MISIAVVAGLTIIAVFGGVLAVVTRAIETFAALERERRVDDDKVAALREEFEDVKKKVDKLGNSRAIDKLGRS